MGWPGFPPVPRWPGRPPLRGLRSVRDGLCRFNGGHDRVDVFQPAVLDSVADNLRLFRCAVSHGMDQGQGRFALRQIVTDILADILI